jgi:prepilin-type N-terminal cleavage/methylation domain-containing protein
MKKPTGRLSFQSAFSLVELLVVIAVIAVIAAIAIPNISGITSSATKAAAKRNAQNIASVSAAAAAAGYTNTAATVAAKIAVFMTDTGVTVTNNGQVMGPFRVDGLPAGVTSDTNVTRNLTEEAGTGILRYTPSTNTD